MSLIIGVALAAIIGYAGYRRGALSGSGVAGAIITGGLIFGMGGWSGAALLLAFFFSSSALSRFREAQKESLSEKFSKGSQRDLAQALANGGVAAACMAGFAFTGAPVWWVAAAAALAAANADTWATELGVLNRHSPRLITNGELVDVGTSGGVSWLGSAAAFAGSSLIGATAAAGILLDPPLAGVSVGVALVIVSAAGLAGSLFDSVLGATVQAIYFCDTCQKETERHPLHKCGAHTRLLRGWQWLDNDGVNFAAAAFGAAIAFGATLFLYSTRRFGF